jgi:hypothetical protein
MWKDGASSWTVLCLVAAGLMLGVGVAFVAQGNLVGRVDHARVEPRSGYLSALRRFRTYNISTYSAITSWSQVWYVLSSTILHNLLIRVSLMPRQQCCILT